MFAIDDDGYISTVRWKQFALSSYRVKVTATDRGGASDVAYVTIDTDATPQAPRNLSASVTRNNRVKLSWDPPANENRDVPVTGYHIQWSANAGEGSSRFLLVLVENTGKTETTYTHTLGHAPNERVLGYRVRAINRVGKGTASTMLRVRQVPDTTGPRVREARLTSDGRTLEVTFDETIDKTTLPGADAFTVTVDGVEAALSETVGASDFHGRLHLTLAEPLSAARVVSLRYDAPTSGRAVRDVVGNKAGSFTIEVDNQSEAIGQTPVLSSMEVSTTGTDIVLSFNTELDARAGRTPPLSAFAMELRLYDSVNDTTYVKPVRVGAITVSGDEVHLTNLMPTIRASIPGLTRTVFVTYTDPTAGNDTAAIQSADGNDASNFSGLATNNSTVTASDAGVGPAPVTTAVEETGTRMLVTFDENISSGLPPTSAWSVTASETQIEIRTTSRLGLNAIILSGLWPTIRQAQTVRVSYRRPTSGNVLEDTSGNDAESFSDVPVFNSSTVTGLVVADAQGTEGIDAAITFEVTLIPAATSQVTVDYATSDGTATQPGDYTSTSGTLTFAVGETRKTVSVPILDDTVEDDGESFTLTLSNASGADIVDATATGTIRNTEAVPHVTAVAIAPDDSGDRRWTPGETLAAHLTFNEAVTVSGGALLDITVAGAPAMLGYTSGSGGTTLVFSTTVPSAGRELTQVAVKENGLATHGTVIVSAATGLAADLAHEGTEPTEAPGAGGSNALTAELRDLPEDGHGGAAFSLKLRFGEEFPLSFRTLRDHALGVAGGTLTGVARTTPGENQVWNLEVTPDTGANDVTVRLEASPHCTDAGSICTADNRRLEGPVSVTVPRTTQPAQPFTVRFANVPDEHDGASALAFKVLFNKEPAGGFSYRTMRDATLEIRQGGETLTATNASRLNAPHNDQWQVTVTPASKADLTVSVGPFSSCTQTGAVCAAGSEVLSNAVAKTILGPPGLSVADARVDEAPGATVDFAVTLARASKATVTVDYATSDGTGANAATAGADYTATSDTLTFAPGETEKTVSVPVLDDSHDEGEETFTLTLSNPQGGNAWLKDATATGTIVNTDAMPKAWLARFGRTVAEQVLDAVGARLRTAPRAGVEATLAGEALPRWNADGTGAGGTNDSGTEDAAARAKAAREAEAQEAEAKERLTSFSDWLRGGREDGRDGADRAGFRSRAVTERDLLTGTSFALSAEAAGGGLVSLWGRGAVSRFDGREGDLWLDGEVASAMLGADWTREAWTAGLLVSHSRGEGGYRGRGEGTVTSSVTGLYPYGRYMVNPRVALWGVAGYGEGELALTPKGQGALGTDMELAMGAVGVRGVAVEAGPQGGVELAVTSDAMVVRTSSEKAAGLAAAEAEVTRLRLGLEGTRRGLEAGGGTLAPRLEVGVRHDGGDAETGFGLDLGGGLAWSHPESGVSAEVSGRGLLTHEAGGFRDRGLSGSFAWDPGGGSGRGPKLTLTQTVGASASGGMDALLGRGTMAGLAANDPGSRSGAGDDLANRRLELRLGYGFPAFGERFTSTPELGLGLANGRREYSLGWRLNLSQGGPTALELRLEATRRETANDNEDPEHGVGLKLTARW